MHIAVCMDIAADRKQLERLLGRSTDKRIAQDKDFPFYIQSYGNKDALLRRPLLYDLFFIDLTQDEIDSVELIHRLRKLGVKSTIVLCPGSIDLSDRLVPEDDVLVLRQPIKADELEKMIDIAVEEVKSRVPKIEFRNNADTIQVLPEDFLYAERTKENTVVHLKDEDEFIAIEKIDNMWKRLAGYDDIYNLPDNLIVNKHYVKTTGLSSVTLMNDRKFKVNHKWLKYMKAKAFNQ